VKLCDLDVAPEPPKRDDWINVVTREMRHHAQFRTHDHFGFSGLQAAIACLYGRSEAQAKKRLMKPLGCLAALRSVISICFGWQKNVDPRPRHLRLKYRSFPEALGHRVRKVASRRISRIIRCQSDPDLYEAIISSSQICKRASRERPPWRAIGRMNLSSSPSDPPTAICCSKPITAAGPQRFSEAMLRQL
jgi:hypothetical protein